MLLEKKELENFIESVYDSSNLYKSIYNKINNELFIFFHKGGVYLYTPVTKEFLDEFNEAESQGKFFHKKIKNNKNIFMKKAFNMYESEKKQLKETIEILKEKINEEEETK